MKSVVYTRKDQPECNSNTVDKIVLSNFVVHNNLNLNEYEYVDEDIQGNVDQKVTEIQRRHTDDVE